jgi:hypothetical protein
VDLRASIDDRPWRLTGFDGGGAGRQAREAGAGITRTTSTTRRGRRLHLPASLRLPWCVRRTRAAAFDSIIFKMHQP